VFLIYSKLFASQLFSLENSDYSEGYMDANGFCKKAFGAIECISRK